MPENVDVEVAAVAIVGPHVIAKAWEAMSVPLVLHADGADGAGDITGWWIEEDQYRTLVDDFQRLAEFGEQIDDLKEENESLKARVAELESEKSEETLKARIARLESDLTAKSQQPEPPRKKRSFTFRYSPKGDPIGLVADEE